MRRMCMLLAFLAAAQTAQAGAPSKGPNKGTTKQCEKGKCHRVAVFSGHNFHASAMDIRIPGVNVYELYKYAESLDAGGIGLGIYPTGGFIHFDYRAPGEPSYRWTDWSGHGGGSKKPTGRTQPARKPT